MFTVKYNSTEFPLLNLPKIKNSSFVLTFSNVVMDFTGFTIDDLPFKYQQVEILEDTTVIAIAYVDEIKLPSFTTGNEVLKVSLRLFSPQVFSSKRSITTVIKATSLKTSVANIVSPLIDDGFTIAFNDLTTSTRITETYIKKPLEKILNELAKRFNFIWFINENKEIFFYDIGNLLVSTPIETFNDLTTNKYLEEIIPKIKSVDYANVINIKNIINVRGSEELFKGSSLVLNGDEDLDLVYNVWLTEEAVFKENPFIVTASNIVAIILFNVTTASSIIYRVGFDKTLPEGSRFVFDSDVGIDGIDNDDPTKEVLLKIKNDIVTGIKFNFSSSDTIELSKITSNIALVPFSFTFYDVNEINKSISLLQTTGLIEKTISVDRKFYSTEEIFEIANGNLIQANNEIGVVTLKFKNENTTEFKDFVDTYQISKKIRINLPELLIVGEFIIIETEKKYNQNLFEYKVTCKNINFNETFLDIYRNAETQENSEQILKNGVGILVQDEDFIERPNIVVNGVVVNELN